VFYFLKMSLSKIRNMENTLLKSGKICLLALGMTVWAYSQKASAQFSGTIGFDGVATFDGPLESSGGATEFTAIYGITGPGSEPEVTYGSTSGGYSVIPVTTQATFDTFSFNPLSTTPFPLWSLTYGTTNYSFSITSETIDSESNGFLNIGGDGIAYVNGTPYTDATWDITDTGNGFALSFGEGTSVLPTPTPEPSSSLMLLGGLAALYCLSLCRRNLKQDRSN
jgi:PEP-CTERM motif